MRLEDFSSQVESPDFAANFDVYIAGNRDAVITLSAHDIDDEDYESDQFYEIGKMRKNTVIQNLSS